MVRVATAEALAVIFETRRLDKFKRKGDVDSAEIINKIKKLVEQAKSSSRKIVKNTREKLQIILEFLYFHSITHFFLTPYNEHSIW